MPIKAVENFNCPVDQIDTLDFAVDEIHMSQNFAHWIDDVSEIQVARGDFVQHRSEQEEIVLADHGDFKIGIAAFLEFNGGIDRQVLQPRGDWSARAHRGWRRVSALIFEQSLNQCR